MHSTQLTWTWRGNTVDLGFDTSGQGPTVLLLPALSSISTRREMWPLQQRLSSHYRTISVDWPGFGDQARPAIDWTPAAYAAFLEYLLEAVAPCPHAVIAAGHAATYALAHACARPASLGGLVLLAPTWRALADNDEWTPAVFLSTLQSGRPAGTRIPALQVERQSRRRSLHGRRARLRGPGVAER